MITQYSFTDLTGSMYHPAAGTYLFQGQAGLKSITVEPSTDNSVHDVAADGSVMVTKVAGRNGLVTFEMQQSSDFHRYLLQAYNTAYYSQDTSLWAAFSIYFRMITDGSVHNLNGCSFQKSATKPYQAQGQSVTWVMMVADIQDM